MEHLTLSEEFRARRQMASPEEGGSANWAISYGDMITLLLAFFVLFFNIDAQDSKAGKAGADMVALVDELQKGHPISEGSGLYQKPPQPDLFWGAESRKPSALMGAPKMGRSVKLDPNLEGNKLLLDFPDISFFPSGQYILTRKGKRALAEVAQTLAKFDGPLRIIIRGYTDNRPVKNARSVYKDNLELSALRAIAALRELNRHGVPLKMMRLGGYGETDKAASISPKEKLKYDRKVVLVIEPVDVTERGFTPKKPASKNSKGAKNG